MVIVECATFMTGSGKRFPSRRNRVCKGQETEPKTSWSGLGTSSFLGWLLCGVMLGPSSCSSSLKNETPFSTSGNGATQRRSRRSKR